MKALLILLLSCFSPLIASVSIQSPPQWQKIDDPTQLPKKVRCLIVAPTREKFSPTLNVSCDETTTDCLSYAKEALSYHQSFPLTDCELLNPISSTQGEMQLIQIDKETDLGKVRFLQAFFVYENQVYVLTGTCLKNDYSKFGPTFVSMIKSFEVTSS